MLRRLEFHYVPKHASWLNMVGSEIVVLRTNARIDASIEIGRAYPAPASAPQLRTKGSSGLFGPRNWELTQPFKRPPST